MFLNFLVHSKAFRSGRTINKRPITGNHRLKHRKQIFRQNCTTHGSWTSGSYNKLYSISIVCFWGRVLTDTLNWSTPCGNLAVGGSFINFRSFSDLVSSNNSLVCEAELQPAFHYKSWDVSNDISLCYLLPRKQKKNFFGLLAEVCKLRGLS